ncbi:MAG: hypothetical protein HY901_25980, partial [Deltaproteobacteria bacterium]|nr:hypothetical protein [Deltaproteobacteria bacterium]
MAGDSISAEAVVLVVGEGAVADACVRGLAERAVDPIQAVDVQPLEERAFDVVVLASRAEPLIAEVRRAHAGPLVTIGGAAAELGSGLGRVYVAEGPQEAVALAAELVWTSPRGRMRALFGAIESAFAALTPAEGLYRALLRLAPAFPADRCSAILIEGDRAPTVVATSDVLGFRREVPLDLYPEIKEALRARSPVVIQDALGRQTSAFQGQTYLYPEYSIYANSFNDYAYNGLDPHDGYGKIVF